MESAFTRRRVFSALAARVPHSSGSQRSDGAVVRADWGLDDPSGSNALVAVNLFAVAIARGFPEDAPISPERETAARDSCSRALDSLLNYRRESGLTDLRDCNFDSSPDAGFLLQALAPAIDSARSFLADDPDWSNVLARAEDFARGLVSGMIDGGFHTPNHRWVIAAALAQGIRLFPETGFPELAGARRAMLSYLAEGFDLDADGAWLEKSAGVYDAICDRSLLILATEPAVPGDIRAAALDAVVRNLELDEFLFHADQTIETGLSIRQDQGVRSVPSSLAAPYLWAGILADRPDFLARARAIWDASPHKDAFGVAQVLRSHGEPAASNSLLLPTTFARTFPAVGLHRIRTERRSVSVFARQIRLLNLAHGAASLVSLSIHHAYFGVGQFVGEIMDVSLDGAITLMFSGETHPRRPGYDLPTGRPVPAEAFYKTRGERAVRRVPPARSTLAIHPTETGLSLRFQSETALDRVPAQIALDFPEGGVWETESASFAPRADQAILHRRGPGRMRFGADAIEISAGSDAHAMFAMRDSQPAAPGLVRVLIPLVTPVDFAFEIRSFPTEATRP